MTDEMSCSEKPLDENARREFLDEHYPLVERGAEPPGRAVNDVSEGKMYWRTRHGDAVVCWSCGQPRSVSDALLPTGEKTDCEVLGEYARFHDAENCIWQWGTFALRDDRVDFSPLPSPPYSLIDEELNGLEAAIAADAVLGERLKSRLFAQVVYLHLKNGYYRHVRSGTFELLGLRGFAHSLAMMRGRGEIYLDYYGEYLRWNGGNPEYAPLFTEVDDHLPRLGYRRVTKSDCLELMRSTLDLIESIEVRAPGRAATPDAAEFIGQYSPGTYWYTEPPDEELGELGAAFHPPHIEKRIERLVKSGRIAQTEHRDLRGQMQFFKSCLDDVAARDPRNRQMLEQMPRTIEDMIKLLNP